MKSPLPQPKRNYVCHYGIWKTDYKSGKTLNLDATYYEIIKPQKSV
jgi:hypothetical protein